MRWLFKDSIHHLFNQLQIELGFCTGSDETLDSAISIKLLSISYDIVLLLSD